MAQPNNGTADSTPGILYNEAHLLHADHSRTYQHSSVPNTTATPLNGYYQHLGGLTTPVAHQTPTNYPIHTYSLAAYGPPPVVPAGVIVSSPVTYAPTGSDQTGSIAARTVPSLTAIPTALPSPCLPTTSSAPPQHSYAPGQNEPYLPPHPVSSFCPPEPVPSQLSSQYTMTQHQHFVEQNYVDFPEPVGLTRAGELETLTVHAFDWAVEDQPDNAHIRCWALDRNSVPYCLIADDFPCWFYVELPSRLDGRVHVWNKTKVDKLFQVIATALAFLPGGDSSCWYPHPETGKAHAFVTKHKLYYYHNNVKYPFLKLSFHTLTAMRACVALLRNGVRYSPYDQHTNHKTSFTVHEDYFSMVRKLLTQQKVKFSGWFTVQAYPVIRGERITTLEKEYVINWDTMAPVDGAICSEWVTTPGEMAMDIECYSNNHRVMPDKYNVLHCAYMISAIYQRYKDDSTRQRYGIVIGECNHIPPEQLLNTTIYQVKDEMEMIECYAHIVRTCDPDIITGYNILSFDYPYLNCRIRSNSRKWPVLGRLRGRAAHVTTSTWKSGAYGHNVVNTLHMEGRISIDLLPIMKRQEGRLDDYTLNTVCKKLLGKSKHDISAPQMFTIYEDMRNTCGEMVRLRRWEQDHPVEAQDPAFQAALGAAISAYELAKSKTTEVMAYCIQDSELVLDLMHHVDVWVTMIQMSNVVGVSIVDVFTRGQQIRCVSQIYDLAAQPENNVVIDKIDQVLYKYCGGTVMTPVTGVNRNIICLDFASLYPSIIMAYNMCYTTLIPQDQAGHIPDDWVHIVTFEQEEVIEPVLNKPALGEEYDELLPEGEEADEKEIFKETVKTKKTEKKTITRRYTFKFLKDPKDCPEHGKVGLLPKLVRNLVRERREAQADMKKTKNPTVKSNLDKLQLALKVAANSLYGFLGVQVNGMLPLLEAAMSVTAKGRELIGRVRRYVEDNYGGKIIYGDTDSVMFDLNITDPKECHYWGMRLSQEISGVKAGEELPDGSGKHLTDRAGLFESPLAMAFEKAMAVLLCITKKKYAATLLDKHGGLRRIPIKDKDGVTTGYTDEIEVLKRGIVLVRRDNIPLLRDVYGYILKRILLEGDYFECMTYLIDKVQAMFAGTVDYRQFVSTRCLGASYKSASYFMKVFADQLTAAGKIVVPGERLPFVVVTSPPKTLLGMKLRLVDQFLEQRDDRSQTPEELDYMYYLEKVMTKPVSQLVSIGFKAIIDKLWFINWKPTAAAKPIDLHQPVKYLVKMREYHQPLGLMKKWLEDGRVYLLKVGARATVLPTVTKPTFRFIDQTGPVVPVASLKPTFRFVDEPSSSHPMAKSHEFTTHDQEPRAAAGTSEALSVEAHRSPAVWGQSMLVGQGLTQFTGQSFAPTQHKNAGLPSTNSWQDISPGGGWGNSTVSTVPTHNSRDNWAKTSQPGSSNGWLGAPSMNSTSSDGVACVPTLPAFAARAAGDHQTGV